MPKEVVADLASADLFAGFIAGVGVCYTALETKLTGFVRMRNSLLSRGASSDMRSGEIVTS